MATRVVDPIGQAITATEKEIASAAWGDEEPVLDESGDRTIETMGEGLEGQHELDEDDESTEGDELEGEEESEEGDGEADEDTEGETEAAGDKPAGKDKPASKAGDEAEGNVPSARLREVRAERDAIRQQFEAAQAKHAADMAALNARMEQLATSMRAPPKPAEAEVEPKVPDFYEDPAGFMAAQQRPLVETVGRLQQDLAAQRVETGMAIAHSKHGDTFAKAFEAMNKLNPHNTEDRATVQRIYAAGGNAGEALVAWYKRSETLREVGDDPTKYRERIEAELRDKLTKDPEFRKSLIDGLRAEASTGQDGKPNTTVRLPRSLNGAAGGNRRDASTVVYDDNDSAIAANAWVDN